MTDDDPLARARAFAARGEDEQAKHAYVYVLRFDPTHFAALNELGALAAASGHRSAARTAWQQAVLHHPGNPLGRVNLGTLLLEDGDLTGATTQFQAALAADPAFPEAHQGLARVLTELGDPAAEDHWRQGFTGHAVVTKPYRGSGPGVPLLLLVSARGGNIPVRHWINDRTFAVTAIHAGYADPAGPLPPHALVVNAIGDADRCGAALDRAEALLRHTTAPVINPPARVRVTGRVQNAKRLGMVPGVVTPRIDVLPQADVMAAPDLRFPLLLRAPGFHTGQHFHYVADRAGLAAAAAMPGDQVLAIQYLDARGADDMVRKYRVMFIDGVVYPWHLAVSADWKVHYVTADMATNAGFRAEEARFLTDMAGVLGEPAMAALAGIAATLGLDYAGADFALAPDGSVLLFEANATMVVAPPDPDPMWDYRRPAADAVLAAVRRMLSRR